MFRVTENQGLTRRSFLQAGMLGVGGMGLADLLRLRASGAVKASSPDTSVILFWLSGGPGHMETWDPKPDAPAAFRGPFGATRTTVPEIQLGELMPEQARIMDKLAVLRTVNHGSGDHTKANHWMLTGFEGPAFNAPDFMRQRRPCMGSAAARLRPAGKPGMLPYLAVPHLKGGTDNFFHYAAYLGSQSNPFVMNSDPNTAGFAVKGVARPADMPFNRLESRRHLLDAMDGFCRQAERKPMEIDGYYQRAFELLTSPAVTAAFDISAEPSKIRDDYGRHTYGQSALLARRLVEAGAVFVTVNCVPWDHHGTENRLPTEEGAKLLIPHLDRAIAALVRDLISRGLYEKTLVVAMGEFGRTPRMNAYGGRDHWGDTFSVMMGCGGMNMGQAVGRTTSRGERPAERPLNPQDVAATIYHHLGIDGRGTEFRDQLNRPMYLVEEGEPIRELLA